MNIIIHEIFMEAQVCGINMQNKKILKQNGFVTMFSVLILGVVALAIASSVLLSGLGSSMTSSTIEKSGKAKSLANLCAEAALQEIRNSTPFFGVDTINIGSDYCIYTVVDNGAEDRTITGEGAVGTVARKVLITIDQINPSINVTSWQEIP